MRKISKEHENPIDNILIDISELLSPLFYKLNFTPNMITTLSLITGLISIHFLKIKQYRLSAILYFISYFFDCMDGFYARKYNMVSKFGDYYDHIKDVFISIILIYLILKNQKNIKCKIILLVIFNFLSMIQLGCQERLYDKDESDSLSFTKYLCPNPMSTIKWSRYFGCGTFIVIVCLFINSLV